VTLPRPQGEKSDKGKKINAAGAESVEEGQSMRELSVSLMSLVGQK
jgi:hypothetical protein